MPDLLSGKYLPIGFEYPRALVRMVGLGLTNLEPWHILQGSRLRERAGGLTRRFPERLLVPFALREDNDDVACWDLARGSESVVVIHDFASPGWEDRVEHPNFESWLHQAVEDMVRFE